MSADMMTNWRVSTLAVNRESLPVVGDTVYNHTADRRSHNRLQSDRSPRMSNTQDQPAAGTGCTAHSCFCIPSWTATICALTAAAACSLNSRGRKRHTAEQHFHFIIWLVLQTNKSACSQQAQSLWELTCWQPGLVSGVYHSVLQHPDTPLTPASAAAHQGTEQSHSPYSETHRQWSNDRGGGPCKSSWLHLLNWMQEYIDTWTTSLRPPKQLKKWWHQGCGSSWCTIWASIHKLLANQLTTNWFWHRSSVRAEILNMTI